MPRVRAVLAPTTLSLAWSLSGCLAAPFVGAGSAALGGSVSYFSDGDVRYAAMAPFAQASDAVETAIADLGFEAVDVMGKPDGENPRSIWKLRSERGSAARLELRQVTGAVTILHIDVDVLEKGSDSGPIARLFAKRYGLALGLGDEEG
ncbi:MAG: hypothetical protein AAF108_01525 [Planctomycetota bacterium]